MYLSNAIEKLSIIIWVPRTKNSTIDAKLSIHFNNPAIVIARAGGLIHNT